MTERMFVSGVTIIIREHIPLKQGLRQFVSRLNQAMEERIREHIPLKQGLTFNTITMDFTERQKE